MSLSLTHSEPPGDQSPSTEMNKQDRAQPFATASFRRSWSLNMICPCCVLLCNALLFPPHSETFSFVLTGEDGSRRFGYCRRLLVSTLASQSSKALRRASAGFLWFPVHHERRDRKCGGLTGSLKTWRKVWVSRASRGTVPPHPLERKYFLQCLPHQLKGLSLLKPNVISNKTCQTDLDSLARTFIMVAKGRRRMDLLLFLAQIIQECLLPNNPL